MPHARFYDVMTQSTNSIGQTISINQDKQGFIWFGGSEGLARYDGYEFKTYTHQANQPDSISNNVIWDILVTKDGTLWLATNKGLNRYNKYLDTFEKPLNSLKIRGHTQLTTDKLSSIEIRALLETQDGSIWMATGGGGVLRYQVEPQTLTSFQHNPKSHNSLTDNFVYSLYEDSENRIWGGTQTGFSIINPKTDNILRHQHPITDDYSQRLNLIRDITSDRSNQIWLATQAGLAKFNLHTKLFEPFNVDSGVSLRGVDIWDILIDNEGLFWLATDGHGLIVLDQNNKRSVQFGHQAGVSDSINSNTIRTLHLDSANDLWAGSFPSGANLFDRSSGNIALYQHNPSNNNSLNNKSVLSILVENENTWWLGTDGGGLDKFNPSTGQFKHFQRIPSQTNSLSGNAILSLHQQSESELWVGTWGGGITLFDPIKETYKHYQHDPKKTNSISSPYIWAIDEDKEGQLWFSTFNGGLNRLNQDEQNFTHYKHDKTNEKSIRDNIVWDVLEDSQNNFWVATNTGLDKFNRATEEFTHVGNPDDSLSLYHVAINTLFEDSKKRLWAGTKSGLYLINTSDLSYQRINKQQGLNNEVILNITEDDQGYLWLGHQAGLSRYHPDNNTVNNFDGKGWLKGKINAGIANKELTDYLIFGGINGFSYFKTRDLEVAQKEPPLILTGLEIFNKQADFGNKKSAISMPIEHAKHIKLSHYQSVFSLTFSALSYTGSHGNKYAYKLDGFDEDWNNVNQLRRATYTNLDPGEYTFHVIGSNDEGVWNKQGHSIKISILPPPWKTWWAYCLYVLIVIGLFFLRILSEKRKLKVALEKVRMERVVSHKLRHIDRLKDDFLANTSHELRTPLHGIIGLADSLIEGVAGQLSNEAKENLLMISASGNRLANLVNDILDFSRLRNDEIKVDIKDVDLNSVIDVVLTLCKPSAEEKSLSLYNNIANNLPIVSADEDRLQQILYNLIGNAIKFTDQGSVSIESEIKDNEAWIHVIDTGIGITADKLDKVYGSFEQLESHESRKFGGAGLGLAVTKRLVELHKGKIKLESTRGKGSKFSFMLPLSQSQATSTKKQNKANFKNLYNEDKLKNKTEKPNNKIEPQNALNNYSNTTIDMGSRDNSEFHILIVDDEPVNRQVLLNQLKVFNYQISEACDGVEALDLLKKGQHYDLILLDVMMPGMSGYEVCTEIRKTTPMQELPIIFLTAKNLISDLVDGFDVGANDFLTKPVSKDELKSRVKTHLQLLDINQNLESKVLDRTQEVQSANRELKALDALVETINQEVKSDRLLSVLLKEASTLFSAITSASYWQYSANKGIFKCISACGYKSQTEKPLKMQYQHLARSFEIHEKKLAEHIYLSQPEAGMSGLYDINNHQAPQCQIIMEMIIDKKMAGYLVLENADDKNKLSQYDMGTLTRFRVHALSALSKAKLLETMRHQFDMMQEISLTDQLTGLRNRHYFFKHIKDDIQQSNKRHANAIPIDKMDDGDLIFFLIDIDLFKSINDTYGHHAGDLMLIEAKNVLTSVFKKSDHLIRWGGEEFLVVARFSDRDKACQLAEKLRSTFAEYEFDIGIGTKIRKTISIGFACYPLIKGQTYESNWESILDIADHCSYAAKRSQRNAWVGLLANDECLNTKLHTELLTEPQKNIGNGEVELVSSIQDLSKINWQ